MVKLSVIIANYNKEKYIRKSLNSVLAQTYKDYEIVVVDDCSTDNSPAIIKKYAAKYPCIKAIYFKENHGVAYSRHHAILNSTGEYLTTLDSDDFYLNAHKLKREMGIIKKNKNVCVSSKMIVLENGRLGRGRFFRGGRKRIKGKYIFKNRVFSVPRDFIMSKKAYFSVGGYDISLKTHEDWDLKLRLAYFYKFIDSNGYGTVYRKTHKGLASFAKKSDKKKLLDRFLKTLSNK